MVIKLKRFGNLNISFNITNLSALIIYKLYDIDYWIFLEIKLFILLKIKDINNKNNKSIYYIIIKPVD